MMVEYPAVVQLLVDLQNPSKAKLVADDIERLTDDPRFISLLQIAIRDLKLPCMVVLIQTRSRWQERWCSRG